MKKALPKKARLELIAFMIKAMSYVPNTAYLSYQK